MTEGFVGYIRNELSIATDEDSKVVYASILQVGTNQMKARS